MDVRCYSMGIVNVNESKAQAFRVLSWVIRVMHLGLVERPFVPLIGIVPSFISRGTPYHAKEGNWTYEFFQHFIINCSCWVLLHAPKLEHGTDCFTSPPKEGMLRRKIRRLRPGLNPRTREPEASMLTTRPPKPFIQSVRNQQHWNCVCNARFGFGYLNSGIWFILQWTFITTCVWTSHKAAVWNMNMKLLESCF
jgi:hypothetical protein